jgi:hypothetical protein
VSWGFVIWGVLHGLWLVLERRVMRRKWYRAAPRPLLVGTTFSFLTVSWVFFRADSLAAAGRYLASLVGLGETTGAATVVRGLVATPGQLVALGAAAAIVWLTVPSQRLAATLTGPRVALATAVLWLALAMLSVQGHSGFLYAVF